MHRYQTGWRRYWAGFIDGLVLWPVSLLDSYLGSPHRAVGVLLAWSIVSYSSYWLYSVILHAQFGQTLGKRAVGVRVLDISETRIPTLKQAFVRDCGYIVLNVLALIYTCYRILSGSYLSMEDTDTLASAVLAWTAIGWFSLEIVTMVTNYKRRAFHDYLAGTVVSERPNQALQTTLMTRSVYEKTIEFWHPQRGV